MVGRVEATQRAATVTAVLARSLADPRGGQLAAGLTHLGPVFVKFGQFGASIPAFFPYRLRRSLRGLLDSVPPFGGDVAFRRAQRSLGDRLRDFDEHPLASASLAQVHHARIDGRPGVVKVLRPGIEEQIELDLAVLGSVLPYMEKVVPGAWLARPRELLEEFAATVRREADLRIEAAEASRAREFLRGVGALDVIVPEQLGGDAHVLAMEQVDGFPLDDHEALLGSGLDPGPLLQSMLLRLQETALVAGHFHGDLHAGNVLVESGTGQLAWIDWGIVGTLDEHQSVAAGRFFFGALERDFDLMLEGLAPFGVLPAARGPLARDLERVLAPLLDDGLAAVDMSRMVRRALRVMARHRVRLPLELVLLAKQVVYFDSYARALVPGRRLMEDATEVFAYFVERYPDLVDRMTEGRVSRLAGVLR